MSAKVALAFVAMLAFVNSQSYLDALVQQIMPESSDQPKSNCLCKGPACICCVDFNMTLLDLGGPGCIHMKYISPEEGLSVKVTYDKKFLQSSKVKGPHPTPVCVNIYGVHAQVCANFNDLAPTADGLRGCSKLELKLLGSSQLEFPIGCFKSSAGVMEMEDPPVEPEKEETTEEPTTEDTNIFDPEAFLINIYQTAEEGVAFLGSLLNIPSKKNSTTTEQPATTVSQESNSQRRSPKHFKHPNQL